MNATAQPRPCTACKKHHISVAPGLCPDCDSDNRLYQATRKKGDPRQFMPYPQLLDQWRRRRAECRDWKKIAEQAATDRAEREQAEREKSYLWAVLNALNADLDPALALAAERDKTRAELGRAEAMIRALQTRIDVLQAQKTLLVDSDLSRPDFPPEQWRRLVQLAHPDKHGGSVASLEATRWLLDNRP